MMTDFVGVEVQLPDRYLNLTLDGFDKIGSPYLKALRKIFDPTEVNLFCPAGVK